MTKYALVDSLSTVASSAINVDSIAEGLKLLDTKSRHWKLVSYEDGNYTHTVKVLYKYGYVKGMSSLGLVAAICRLSEMFPDNVVTAVEYEDGSGNNYNYSLDGGKWQFINFKELNK